MHPNTFAEKRNSHITDRSFGVLSFIHTFLVLTAFFSPFLFNWRLVAILMILYYLQLLLFGGCILTQYEFGRKRRDDTFIYFLLHKLGLIFERRTVKVISDVLPLFYVAAAIFLQVFREFNPILI